jgi:serpin B
LVLTNAIYFKADWSSQFDIAATKDGPFFVNENTTKDVPLMRQKGRFVYYENDRLQRLTLPYKAGDTMMEIILPRDSKKLADIEQDLSLEKFAEWNESARPLEVEVFLPRFKTTVSFQMKSVLSKLGMERAFSDEAEFGGITSQEELRISEVVHKAFVEVDEKGTEAAAATGVIMATKMARPQEPFVFRADRPFLILIRHQPSGLILFMGRIADPQPN